MTNPNDAIREKLLQYLYQRHANGTSNQGKRGRQVRISDLKKELKQLHGFTQQEVVANLSYLIDRNWVREYRVEKSVQTARGTIPSAVEWYGISADGVDEIESGESRFRNEKLGGINIQALGENVITLGSGNVVNARFKDISPKLEELREVVLASDDIEDRTKLEVVSDLDAIGSQLAKAAPDANLVQTLWAGVEKAVTGTQAGQLAVLAGQHLSSLF